MRPAGAWLLRSSRRVGARFRHRRWLLVQWALGLRGTESVVDVGGVAQSAWFARWKGLVVRCNVDRTALGARLIVLADGRWLPFRDKSFDVAFSNSVIEHLQSLEDQARLAAELTRVGRSHFIQTPNKLFPIEPHYLFPFFQFLPTRVQQWLHAHFDLGNIRRSDPFGTIRLLTKEVAAFLANQALEKYLTGSWITLKREAAAHTHSLTELGDALGAPADVRLHLVYLNPDYTTARYPDAANGVPYEVYDRGTAERKVAAAEEAFRWLRPLTQTNR